MRCLSVFLTILLRLHLIHISYAYLTEQGINATLCNIDDVYSNPLTRCPTATLGLTHLCLGVCVCVWRVCRVANKCISGGTGRTMPSFVTHRIELEVRIFIIFQLYCLPRGRYLPPPPPPHTHQFLLSCGCPLRHTTGHSSRGRS